MVKVWGVAIAVVLLTGGCAVEILNQKPAQEVARLAKPPGSLYSGWRVFQDRCAGCHGAAATGGAGAPDLLPLVRDMGSRRFVGLVLNRYDWNLPPDQAKRGSPGHEALTDDILLRKAQPLSMPAWQGEPVVTVHIVDLFAYLSARAQGVQDTGRPAP